MASALMNILSALNEVRRIYLKHSDHALNALEETFGGSAGLYRASKEIITDTMRGTARRQRTSYVGSTQRRSRTTTSLQSLPASSPL